MLPKLTHLLADGEFHSGKTLGQALGLGRAAVWKQVQALGLRGLRIVAVRGKGYRSVSRLDLLDEQVIRGMMGACATGAFPNIDVLDLVDSTNDACISRVRATKAKGYVCFAEQQSAGRGRRGRRWVSPFGRNIYASVAWSFEGGLPATQGLSIAIGVAVCEAVEALGCAGIKLKWPNDIYCHGAKLGGILIDVVGDVDGECFVVIGVGLNVVMSADDGVGIEQRWTDLANAGCHVPRNQIAATLLNSISRVLFAFGRGGLGEFRAEWDRLDMLRGRQVSVQIGQETAVGVAAGINDAGALVLSTTGGDRFFSGGEVSVRGWQ